MTADELDKQIREIKKKGNHYIVEQSQISALRKEYYMTLQYKKLRSITATFYNNVQLLSKIHKVYPRSTSIKEYMGIEVDHSFDDMMKNQNSLYNIHHVILVSLFYGVPVELLLFQDLTINEERIKNEYPAIFKQNKY